MENYSTSWKKQEFGGVADALGLIGADRFRVQKYFEKRFAKP